MGRIGARWSAWTDDEDAKLKQACDGKTMVGNASWEPIAVDFPGRSALACRQRWLFLRDEAAGKTPRDRSRERVANYRRVQKQARETGPTPIMAAPKPPDPVPMTYAVFANHLVFGDPLPGRSALDQKRNTTTTGENHASHY